MIKTGTSTTTLRAQLFRTFEDPTYKPPPLPTVAIELTALAAKDDVNVEQVVRLLERDQMLAGAVMRRVADPRRPRPGSLAGRRGAAARDSDRA